MDIVVGTTLPTLDLFKGFKNGDSAFYLFFLYLRQSRIQDTKETYSLDRFMMEGTGWSEDKFRKAKKVLIDLGMIRTLKKRDDKGKIIGYYVGVEHKYRLNEDTLSSTLKNPVQGKTQSLKKSSHGKNGVLNAPVDININAPVEETINAPVGEEGVKTPIPSKPKKKKEKVMLLAVVDNAVKVEAVRIAKWFWDERKDEPINVYWTKRKGEKKFKEDWVEELLLVNRDGFDW